MCLKTGCPRLVITQIISQLLILGNNNLKFSIEVSYIYSTYSSILYCMAYCMYFISRRKIFCYILFYLISGQAKKTNRHLSLQQLHPWRIRFVCRDSDFFGTVQPMTKKYRRLLCIQSAPLTRTIKQFSFFLSFVLIQCIVVKPQMPTAQYWQSFFCYGTVKHKKTLSWYMITIIGAYLRQLSENLIPRKLNLIA